MKKIVTLFIVLFFIMNVHSQSKMIVGEKHTIFINFPEHWLQDINEQSALVLKPELSKSGQNTYMYVLGQDYDINPDLEKWIEGNNSFTLEKDSGLKIGKVDLSLSNLGKKGYLTGRFKTLIYEYTNKRKEALLVIECEHSIITVVLSADNNSEFDKYFSNFIELSKSIKILASKIDEKK